MKIAVPVKGNQIDDHFGHCKYYNVFTISEKNIIEQVEVIESTQGCGCKSNIASELAHSGVSIMLAGGIGSGAVAVLNQEGIQVVQGCSGNAEEAVGKYIAGELTDNGCVCEHHHHDNGCSH